MAAGNKISLGSRVLDQGEVAVGNATVQLKAGVNSFTCSRIWFGAPTSAHTKGGLNTATVLIGSKSTTALNKSGGRPLTLDNALGFDMPFEDAVNVYLTGTVPGDVVEYIIYA